MADTKLIALLGTPLGQSFSPRMQNEAYKAINFDGHYFPLETNNELSATILPISRKITAMLVLP